MTDETIIDAILKREGSAYTNHPADKGGPTKYGITQGTLSEWYGRAATVAEVRALTESAAREIYQQNYIRKPGFDVVQDARLRGLLVDCGVNHGPRTAIKLLQRALGVADDGVFGPVTKAALAKSWSTEWASKLYYLLAAQRIRLYGRIITDNPSQAVFAAGWAARCAEFLEA